MRDKYHIPAPESRAPSPGSAYCGARGPWFIQKPAMMRLWACEQVSAGRAAEFCPSCLAAMLRDSMRPELSGRRGGEARRDALTPEARRAIAVRAAAIRWGRESAQDATGTTNATDGP